jgi:ATP-binding cassette subfamily B (MDR/TAP) protein 1
MSTTEKNQVSDKPYYNKKANDKGKTPGPPKAKKEDSIKFYELYRYCTPGEKLVAFIGCLSAILSGATAPFVAVIMGNIIELFDPTATADEVSEGIKRLLTNISIISGVLWITAYFQYAFLQHMSEKLSFTLRGKYLDSLMRQETAFFEKQKVESIPSQIQEYFSAISNGSGEKVG